MSDVNEFHVRGRMGKDPEVRHFGDRMMCTISVATEVVGDDRKSRTYWHSIAFWGYDAERVNANGQKGQLVDVKGIITYSKKDGRTYTNLTGLNFEVVRGGKEQGQAAPSQEDLW